MANRERAFSLARRRPVMTGGVCALALVLLSCQTVPEPRGYVGSRTRNSSQRRQSQTAATKREPVVPLRPAPENLDKIYELMARNLTRAAAKYYPELYKQTTSRFEEMLRAMLAQAAYESGHFRSALAVDGLNFWGMKDRKDVPTQQILYKGEYYEKFSSMYASCCGYIIALRRPYYADAIRYTSDKKAFLNYIAKSGWCPDRNYATAAIEAYKADKEEIDRAARIAVDEIMNAPKKKKTTAK